MHTWREDEIYKTKDLGEASALMAKGVKIVGLDKDSSFFWFVFEGGGLSQLSDSYWSGEMVVSAREYYDKMRSLKDRLFASNSK